MIDLNLAYSDKSDIKYEKIYYKDSQVDIKLDSRGDYSKVRIVSRMNSYQDLFMILAAADALHKQPHDTELYVPCVLGQRSDREFSHHSSHGLRLIANAINTANFSKVHVLHPHSDVLQGLINNCYVESNYKLVAWAIDYLGKEIVNTVIVSPDAGAFKRSEEYSRIFNLDLIPSVKARVDGLIVQQVAYVGSLEEKTCVIIDDYIDGGRTFSGLAEILKNQYKAKQVVLIVTHGLFSYGFDIPNVDKIFTTNSIQDISHSNIVQMEVI